MKNTHIILSAILALATACGSKGGNSGDNHKPAPQSKDSEKSNTNQPQPNSGQQTPAPSSASKDETAQKTPEAKPTEPPSSNSTPTSQASPATRPIYGTWVSSTLGSEEIKFRIFMKFEQDKITVTSECSAKGISVYSTASSKASYTDQSLQILEAATQVEIVNDIRCSVKVPKATLEYSVSDSQLTLTYNGEVQVLNRVAE